MREVVLRALERCASMGLDTDEERGVVADAVLSALAATPEAHLIRTELANARSSAGYLVVTRAIGGAREGRLLEAAARLAQHAPPGEP
jgi:hypothetical protein